MEEDNFYNELIEYRQKESAPKSSRASDRYKDALQMYKSSFSSLRIIELKPGDLSANYSQLRDTMTADEYKAGEAKIKKIYRIICGYSEQYNSIRIQTYISKKDSDTIDVNAWLRLIVDLAAINKINEERQKEEIQRLRKENEELRQKKAGKFRRASHLAEQMLIYDYPPENSMQLNIFESLKEETKNAIEVSGVERSQVVKGIDLSPSETKIVDCLTKLLDENSQTSDPTKKDYYTGNINHDLIDYGEGEITPAPKLAFTLYEITKEYKGGDLVSGKDVENVKQILNELDKKKFLIKYTETVRGKNGEYIKKEYEGYRKLINIDKATLSYGVGDIEHYKKTETVIQLNPIFIRQIESKYVLYPNDIIQRTRIAYGSHNLSGASLRLRDYLAKEVSAKRYNPEIRLEKLYYLLAEKWMKESRKTLVKKHTDKAIETVKNLGLLIEYKIVAGATGEPKVIFTLNKDWV